MSLVRPWRAVFTALAVILGVNVLVVAPAHAAGSVTVPWSGAVAAGSAAPSIQSFDEAVLAFPAPVSNVVRLRIVTFGSGHSHVTSGVGTPVVLAVHLVPSGTTVWTTTVDTGSQASMAIDVTVPGLSAAGIAITSTPPQAQTFHNFSPSDQVIVDFADAPPSPLATQCGDGVDNDLDGRTDYPSDPGCTSSGDTTESSDASPACPLVAGVPVCTSITSGTVFEAVPVSNVVIGTAATHRVVATVDIYRLDLPTGGFLTVPCVVATVNATPVNPCAAADMTFVSRLVSLVDRSADQPSASLSGTLATVRVCNATVTVTAAGIGLNEFPALTLC